MEFACAAKRVKQGKFMNCEWVKHGNPGVHFFFSSMHIIVYTFDVFTLFDLSIHLVHFIVSG